MFRTLVKHSSYICEAIITPNQFVKRYAGHSKWQNIKHIKGAKDAERSQTFTKIGRFMKVAVAGKYTVIIVKMLIYYSFSEGNGSIDPKLNLKLSQVIDQARRANMPTATIQSILKSCQSDKSQARAHIIEIKLVS